MKRGRCRTTCPADRSAACARAGRRSRSAAGTPVASRSSRASSAEFPIAGPSALTGPMMSPRSMTLSWSAVEVLRRAAAACQVDRLRTSAQTWRKAEPESCTDKLPDVTASFGLRIRAGRDRAHAGPNGMPSPCPTRFAPRRSRCPARVSTLPEYHRPRNRRDRTRSHWPRRGVAVCSAAGQASLRRSRLGCHGLNGAHHAVMRPAATEIAVERLAGFPCRSGEADALQESSRTDEDTCRRDSSRIARPGVRDERRLQRVRVDSAVPEPPRP